MKKEFSFYEFVGLLIPGTILLFFVNLISKHYYNSEVFDFSKVGETAIFLILCYSIGHVIQAIGNIYEAIVWFVFKGMPSKWLTEKNSFKSNLFKEPLNQQIVDKTVAKFGVGIDDYSRLIYNFLYQQNKTGRIDIFNGNYSLFRGLSVVFLIISISTFYFISWKWGLIATAVFILLTRRMIRFAKYYATEVFRTFYNLP